MGETLVNHMVTMGDGLAENSQIRPFLDEIAVDNKMATIIQGYQI
jgi:hypothetical protein